MSMDIHGLLSIRSITDRGYALYRPVTVPSVPAPNGIRSFKTSDCTITFDYTLSELRTRCMDISTAVFLSLEGAVT